MSQLDHSTVVFFCFLCFLIAAPLAVCGAFAVAEFFHRRPKRKKRHVRYLRRVAHRCRPIPPADSAGRTAEGEYARSTPVPAEIESAV